MSLSATFVAVVRCLMSHCRKHWADYFDEQGIKYAFYSAALGIAIQEARKEAVEAMERAAQAEQSEESEEDEVEGKVEEQAKREDEEKAAEKGADSREVVERPKIVISADDDDEDVSDPRIRILSVPELEELFIQTAPPLTGI